MDDLNDLYYFVKVVEYGGFTQAGRALNIAKSKLSRRIATLEDKYKVRLLQRSTRHFSVTEMGQEFYERCVAVLVQADAARDAMQRTQVEPQGVVRMACPTGLLRYKIGDLLARFMAEYPKIQILVEATNRMVDVAGERLDLAVRFLPKPLEDSELMTRVLWTMHSHLVMCPGFITDRHILKLPDDLNGLHSMDWGPPGEHCWNLVGPGGANARVYHRPRYVTDNRTALRQAALHGVGIVVVKEDLKTGALVDVLPDWSPKTFVTHVVYPPRRELIPSVRLLIDYIASSYKGDDLIADHDHLYLHTIQ
jgi:DNA-binding transcriptional LysR family regulator